MRDRNSEVCPTLFTYVWFFSPRYSPSKSMKNAFYFIWKALFILEILKFLYFCLSLFVPVGHCFIGWSKINLKVYDVVNCLNKSLITYFIWYLEKKKRYGIETLSIDRVVNKEHFYGKIIQKMCTKSDEVWWYNMNWFFELFQ